MQRLVLADSERHWPWWLGCRPTDSDSSCARTRVNDRGSRTGAWTKGQSDPLNDGESVKGCHLKIVQIRKSAKKLKFKNFCT